MKQSMRLFTALFVVLLLAFATENGAKVAEARTCASASQKFKGLCVSSRNCENVCQSEGFPSGKCDGLRRRCMCQAPCA